MGGGGARSGINRNKGKVKAGPIDASAPDAFDKLREMALAGVMPTEITGNAKDQSRMYEAIDSIYPDYKGDMANYTVERFGSSIDISYHGGDGTNPKDNGEFTTGGTGWQVRLPGKMKATDAEVRGATKFTIEKHLPELEYTVMYRMDGFATGEMARKWGGSSAFFTDKQKAQIDKELYAHVQKLTGRPISEQAKRYAEINWVRTPQGWSRNTWLNADGTDKRVALDREIAARRARERSN